MATKFSKAQKAHLKLSKKVMQTAWRVARRAAIKFGYKASEFFVMVLRNVWRAYKQEQISLF